jgi:hypothetical protein
MGGNSNQHEKFALRRCFLASVAASLLFSPALPAAQAGNSLPRLTYTKIMKGSVPEYIRLTVDSTGAGTFDGHQLSEAPNPRSLQLSPAVTRRLFDLANQLDDFRSIQLESRKKVANLGEKTFTYQKGARTTSVEFNYTENRAAEELTNLFEGIASVEEHIAGLEYSARFDPLGLPHQLHLAATDLHEHNLIDPQLMAPILKKIVGNNRYLHIAQVQAQDILQRIQDQ